jgi:adenosylcobalamin-dependent ribonucleoside-triphosphate reductase
VRKEARRYAFQLRIPEPIKVTTVAPTGTIAKLPGKTEGIHPIYSRYFKRRVRFGTVDPAQQAQLAEFVAQGLKVEDCIYTPLTKVVEFITLDSLVAEVEEMGLNTDFLVESADEIGFSDMLAVQAMYQECYADNAVSFTINIEPERYTVAQVMDTMIHYLPKLKGTTVMIDNSRPQAPYERITKEEYENYSGIKSVSDSVDENCSSGSCPIK